MVHNLVLALTGRYVGRACRRCGDALVRGDRFGLSEGVCSGCRS
jgi:hypothetical protein